MEHGLPKLIEIRRTIALLTLLAMSLTLLLERWPVVRFLDADFQDLLIRERTLLISKQERRSDSVVLVDIDDASLQALAPVFGKWPWPRSAHAELLEYLLGFEPKAVVFDILFSEPDLYRPDSDSYFAEILADRDNIYLAMLQQQAMEGVDPQLIPRLDSYPEQVGLVRTVTANRDAQALLLLPKAVPENYWRLGSINFLTDADGVGRRYDIYRDIEGWQLPSLPARVASDLGKKLPRGSSLILDWRSNGLEGFRSFNFANLLSQARGEGDPLDSAVFKDKVIIIGTTAAGLLDVRPTPIAETYPGLHILATATDNLLNGHGLKRVDLWQSLLLGAILMVVVGLAFAYIGQMAGVAMTVFSSVGLLALAYVAIWQGWLVSSIPYVIGLTFLCLSILGLFYFRHRIKLRNTVNLFSRFLDPKVVGELVDQSNMEQLLGSNSCEVTVLFTDIRDFTMLSEKITPQAMVSLLNQYFDRQVGTLFRYEATLDKFIGDAIMAFWGAPLPNSRQAVVAIEAALEMIDNLNSFRRETGYTEFNIGIGIHTGTAVVGMIGAQQRYDYTAIGDTVNLASRIEGLTKNRAILLVSEETRLAAGDAFYYRHCGEYVVKGRSQAVNVYEPCRTPPEKVDERD